MNNAGLYLWRPDLLQEDSFCSAASDRRWESCSGFVSGLSVKEAQLISVSQQNSTCMEIFPTPFLLVFFSNPIAIQVFISVLL